MRILAIVGGTNDPSNSDVLADMFLRGAAERGASTAKIRLRDLDIEHFALKFYDPNAKQGTDFENLWEEMEKSDGILIATPVWNFGVPANLKNAIDRMGAFALDAETRTKGTLAGKPFYFLFTGGAPLPAWKGLMRFTTSFVTEGIRYFGGTIVGKYFEGKCTPGKGAFGLVVDKRPDSLEAAKKRGAEFAGFIANLRKTGRLPLYYRVFNECYFWGQRIMAKF